MKKVHLFKTKDIRELSLQPKEIAPFTWWKNMGWDRKISKMTKKNGPGFYLQLNLENPPVYFTIFRLESIGYIVEDEKVYSRPKLIMYFNDDRKWIIEGDSDAYIEYCFNVLAEILQADPTYINTYELQKIFNKFNKCDGSEKL